MKKSANGYFKFFNKDGAHCRIKCSDSIEGSVIIKFKTVNDISWFYHSPKKEFRNCLDVVAYILKNLENDGVIFKIIPESGVLVQTKDAGDNNEI